jgi:ribosomal 50S subunit-associated protein YjgA (DUF615 family)
MKRMLIAIFALWAATQSMAQTREQLLEQLLEEDRANVETLMLYPEETRLHILEATKHPEALIRMQNLQTRSQTAFRALVETYPERVQQQVWDLTRYPNLIERLVGEARGSRSAINRILEEYPAEAREPAIAMNDEQFGLLARIDNLQRESDAAFRNFLTNYPERTAAALRALVNEPEAIELMTENMRTTVQLGDLYSRDPYWMLQQADRISLDAARQRAKDLEAWKQSVESNPEARRDLEQSAQTYAREYSYDDASYNYAPVEQPPYVVTERHYYHAYPYWFGYPYWYTAPRWRPRPYWYDWGFYMRPGGGVVVFDFPSYYFVNWYYRRPIHIYNYPHLAGLYVDYYYGYRRSSCGIVIGVDRWRRRNYAVVGDVWLRDRNGRIDRFREFGRMEDDRERFNRDNPGREIPQREYAVQNTTKYPRLTERLPDPAPADNRPGAPRTNDPRRETAPRITEPRTQQPVEAPRSADPRRETAPRTTEPRTQQPIEAPRSADPRRETAPRTTEPRTQQPIEAPRSVEPRRETAPRTTEPRTQQPVEAPRSVEPRRETVPTRTEAPRSVEPRRETTPTRTEAPRSVEPRRETAPTRTEAPRSVEPRRETAPTRTEAPRSVEPRKDTTPSRSAEPKKDNSPSKTTTPAPARSRSKGGEE